MRREYSSAVETGSIAGSPTACSGHDLPSAAADTAFSDAVVDWKAALKRDEAQHMLYALASVPVVGAAWALQAAFWPLTGAALLPAFSAGSGRADRTSRSEVGRYGTARRPRR